MDRLPRDRAEWDRRVEKRLTFLERFAGRLTATVASQEVNGGGVSGTITLLRQGRVVDITGNLTGTPAAGPVTLFVLDPEWRPVDACKFTVGGSSTTNTSTRLISISAVGTVTLVSSTGGAGIWLNGVHFVSQP